MKKNLCLPLVFLIVLSCSNDDQSQAFKNVINKSGIDYFQSHKNWLQLKNKNGNSYFYQTSFQFWTGFGGITEIKVEDDVVVSRRYWEISGYSNLGERDTTEIFFEDINTLNSNSKGAPPLTIDELYQVCVDEYLMVDSKNNDIYFETTTDGLMSSCGFVPKACTDDCFQGVRITSFSWE